MPDALCLSRLEHPLGGAVCHPPTEAGVERGP